MSALRGLENIEAVEGGRVVAVGVFDGVHWGHRAIFEVVLRVAGERSLRPTALTFDKHPAELLVPDRAPKYINTLDQRVELIRALGIEDAIVVEFDRELASLTKDEFVRQVLIDALDTRHLVVGANFRFGKGRQGDVRYLSRTLPALRTELTIVPAVIIAGGPASSTRIRLLVGKGDVVGAEKLLGRPFALRGTVGMGRQVGRTIGFPTANIETGPRQLVPARGVYAVECAIGKIAYAGVCNIGCRPTFDGGAWTIEVHLAGFEDDIYGETLDVVFRRRLRDEMTFESPERLVEQIGKDLEKAVGER